MHQVTTMVVWNQTIEDGHLQIMNYWGSLCTSCLEFPDSVHNSGLDNSTELQMETSTPIHARAWKKKVLAGYNSQQLPTNNNIHKMLIIIISLRWKHFVIISYLY